MLARFLRLFPIKILIVESVILDLANTRIAIRSLPWLKIIHIVCVNKGVKISHIILSKTRQHHESRIAVIYLHVGPFCTLHDTYPCIQEPHLSLQGCSGWNTKGKTLQLMSSRHVSILFPPGIHTCYCGRYTASPTTSPPVCENREESLTIQRSQAHCWNAFACQRHLQALSPLLPVNSAAVPRGILKDQDLGK